MAHVFISHVREDRDEALRLARALRHAGVDVWLDKERIQPGMRWQVAIRDAIANGAFFIACFSQAYIRRRRTYMNEELICAIDELRQRSADRAWFLPVRLSDVPVPNRRIGAGETLRDIQWVDLFGDWHDGIQQILYVVRPHDAPRDRRYALWARRFLGYVFGRELIGNHEVSAQHIIDDWNQSQSRPAIEASQDTKHILRYVRNLPRTWTDADPDGRPRDQSLLSALGALARATDTDSAYALDLAAVGLVADYAITRGWLVRRGGDGEEIFAFTERGRAEFERQRRELESGLEFP